MRRKNCEGERLYGASLRNPQKQNDLIDPLHFAPLEMLEIRNAVRAGGNADEPVGGGYGGDDVGDGGKRWW